MSKHRFRFFRAGGFDQVRIDSADDLKNLEQLDPKLWVATACPVKDLELDEHTLGLLDADGDGRIRAPEVIAAAEWLTTVLHEPAELLERRDELPLASINGVDDEGKKLRSSARQILENLGKKDAKAITPADTRDTAAIFAKTVFNGDGIVPPESAGEDTATAQAIRDAMSCVGTSKDMSGLDGLSRAQFDQFFAEASAYVAWYLESESDAEAMPLGADTLAAHTALEAVRAKVDDYFTRCALAAMDPRAATAMNTSEADLAALSPKDLSRATESLAALPIAHVTADRALPLHVGLNPAFAAAVASFATTCVAPILGARDALTEAEWRSIEARFAGHRAWLATKPANVVETLGIARLRELVEGEAKAAVDALLVRDEALAPEREAIVAVDKLVHLYRDFAALLHNFIAFSDFYGKKKSAFQAGTLYLDSRSFDLCLRVADVNKHAALATHSMACLAYCECARGAEKMSIVAAVTNGDSDFLHVGRNGIFYDRKGRDWDATIVKLVEQPISIRQAFWSPYKRAARLISQQIERFAGERARESDSMLDRGTELPTAMRGPGIAAAPTAPAAAPAPPAPTSAPAAPSSFDIAKFAGIFAAIGLAVGAIGTAAAAVLTGFLELAWWQMPLAVIGLMLVVSGPAMLLAALKLRQRNLGPLLDAGGWAINSRAMINIPFGEALTHLAVLPPGSSRSLSDPFAEKKKPWRTMIVVASLLAGGTYLARHEIQTALRPHLEDVPVLREWVAEPEGEATAGEAAADATER